MAEYRAARKSPAGSSGGPEGLFGPAVYLLLSPPCLVLADVNDSRPCLPAFTALRSANSLAAWRDWRRRSRPSASMNGASYEFFWTE